MPASLPVIGCFIWTIVENLKELRAPQMIHKLRIKSEVLGKAEAVWIILCIFTKLLTLHTRRICHAHQLTFLIIEPYLLTPWGRVLLEKLTAL
jgi:hypothetical protein